MGREQSEVRGKWCMMKQHRSFMPYVNFFFFEGGKAEDNCYFNFLPIILFVF